MTTDELQKQINSLVEKKAWCQKHGIDSAHFNFIGHQLTAWCLDCDRNDVLQNAEALFGKSGWLEKVTGERLDWTKKFKDVEIIIFNAKIPAPADLVRPVKPTDWPLQITNVEPTV